MDTTLHAVPSADEGGEELLPGRGAGSGLSRRRNLACECVAKPRTRVACGAWLWTRYGEMKTVTSRSV